MALPTEVAEGTAPVKEPYRPVPPHQRQDGQGNPAASKKGDMPAPEPTEKPGVPARALLTLWVAFIVVLELTDIVTLVQTLFTSRLRVSGFRTGSTIFYWAERPWSVAFNLLVGIVGGTDHWPHRLGLPARGDPRSDGEQALRAATRSKSGQKGRAVHDLIQQTCVD